ncbi:MAG: glycosyltransferase family 4 protein [Planctomycetota bacterium]
MRIVDLSVYGVHPARSAGHLAVLEPLVELARLGHEVEVLSLGLRRFERRWPRRFRAAVAERLHETRLVSAWRVLRALATGTTRFPPIDAAATFAALARPEDLARLAAADLVVVESPWVWPFAAAGAGAGRPLVWVAHNVEADLWEDALRDRLGAAGLERARALERRAWQEAALVVALHEEQRRRLAEVYGAREGPVLVQPLGARIAAPADDGRRRDARRALGVPADAVVALFAASAHEPNREAAAFLERIAATTAPDVFVLVAGSVAPGRRGFAGGLATGPLPDLEGCWHAADLALNPVERGSGMNIKVVEALARSLPVLATPFGARGVDAGDGTGVVVADRDGFAAALVALARDPDLRARLAGAAGTQARARYAWPALALERERVFLNLAGAGRGAAPAP